jgi:hypothetical protein
LVEWIVVREDSATVSLKIAVFCADQHGLVSASSFRKTFKTPMDLRQSHHVNHPHGIDQLLGKGVVDLLQEFGVKFNVFVHEELAALGL